MQNFLPKPGTAMHRRPALPARRVPRGHRPGPPDPPRRRPPAGAAEPVRRLRPAARRRHRRLGRRLAGHRRPRQPRAPLARPRPPARRSPRPRGHVAGAPAHHLPRVSRSIPTAGSTTACASRSSTAATPRRLARDDDLVLGRRRHTPRRSCPARPAAGGAVAEVLAGVGRPARSSARTRSSPCSGPGAPRSRPWPRSPTSCGPPRSATSSPTSATATSTTPTSAPSSAGSAASPRGPLSLNLRGQARTCSPSRTSRSGSSRPPSGGPPRSASRAASIPTSTATTTSTSPGR